jgi:hypothetical protein
MDHHDVDEPSTAIMSQSNEVKTLPLPSNRFPFYCVSSGLIIYSFGLFYYIPNISHLLSSETDKQTNKQNAGHFRRGISFHDLTLL